MIKSYICIFFTVQHHQKDVFRTHYHLNLEKRIEGRNPAPGIKVRSMDVTPQWHQGIQGIWLKE